MDIRDTTPLRSFQQNEPDLFYNEASRNRRMNSSFLLYVLFFLLLTLFFTAVAFISMSSVPSNGGEQPNIPNLQYGVLLKSSLSLTNKISNVCKTPANLSQEELNEALSKGEEDWQERLMAEKNNLAKPLPPSHPSFLHQKAIYTSAQSLRASASANKLLAASKYVYANKLQAGDCITRSQRLPLSNWTTEWCFESEPGLKECNVSSPYRTIDGSCNNLVNTNFGAAMKPFRRLLPPAYGDGISSPRQSNALESLPSARTVSLAIHRPSNQTNPKFTMVLAAWGQFIDHDITATALSKRNDGQAITCCNSEWQHPECFPVELTTDDSLYSKYNLTCMDFVRSAPAPICSLGPREQLNQVTPFIDGSAIYGSSADVQSQLRAYSGGLLQRSWTASGKELLSIDRTANDGCNQAELAKKGRFCFKTGDTRANENLPLTSLHLIFSREHNRLATGLKKLNPQWSDEVLYQEARRIVIAQLQHIHYNEFVPVVIGCNLVDYLELSPKKSGYFEGYDASIDPQVSNEFAACAFRFGHTLLQGQFALIDRVGAINDSLMLHKTLFNPFGVYQNEFVESALRGITSTNTKGPGNSVTPELQGNLFKTKSSPCGLDLVSLNIQRGRDHGLPGYPNWREFCGGARPKTFEDLHDLMEEDTVIRLKAIYSTVDDIDPYTGLVSEKPLNTSGILGPTGTCVIAEQFLRLKKGDRFWYESSKVPQAFTQEQLDEIRKTSLSSILCDNSETLEMQPKAMESISEENALIACANLTKLSLEPWLSEQIGIKYKLEK